MTVTLPPDIQQFVDHEISIGRYRTERDLILDAVRRLRERSLRFQRFREDVQAELDCIERGEGVVLEGDEALREYFDQLKTEATREMTEEKATHP